MTTPEQAAKELIENLPEQVTWGDIMYELYVKLKIEAALQTVVVAREKRPA